MAYTDKQLRNGATGSDGEQDSAQPGPVADVAPVKSQAEAAGVAYGREGHALVSALAGHTVSFEWDAGLAISDVEGGGSG